jgi:hypothetical protein
MILSITTLRIKTLNTMTTSITILSITTFNIKAQCITTLSITTFCIMILSIAKFVKIRLDTTMKNATFIMESSMLQFFVIMQNKLV